MWIALIAIATVVGFFIGTVGVGGILLIPPLTLVSNLSIHQASATALFSFFFAGMYGTWLFHRRASTNWAVSLPVCAGAAVFSYLGAWTQSQIGSTGLAAFIAATTILAGLYLLLPAGHATRAAFDGRPRSQLFLLFFVGAVAGFGSGLSGAGGPLFSVPLMLLLGFAPLTAVGTGQVLQIVAASFGSISHLQNDSIHFTVAACLVVGELIGVTVGVWWAHRAKAVHLRVMVSALCVLVGAWMLIRLLG